MTEKDIKEIIDQSEKIVIVDFYAQWCGPCKSLEMTLENVKNIAGNRIELITVDVDKYPDIARKNDIMSVPTCHFYKNSIKYNTMTGLRSEDDIINIINECQS